MHDWKSKTTNINIFLKTIMRGYELNLHNMRWVPMNGIVMVIGSGVEPRVELLFSASSSLRIYVRVDNVRLPRYISQKLEIYLIMLLTC